MSEEMKSPTRARQAETSKRYLTFQLGKEQYAIPLLQVKEVIEMSEPTPVPQTPAFYKGILNLRGQVISILDLRSKLQLTKIEDGPKTAIIILDLEAQLYLGVVVDRINSVMAFQGEEIGSPPDTFTGGREQYLTGVAKKDGKMTLILDIRAALSLQDISATIRQQSQKQAA